MSGGAAAPVLLGSIFTKCRCRKLQQQKQTTLRHTREGGYACAPGFLGALARFKSFQAAILTWPGGTRAATGDPSPEDNPRAGTACPEQKLPILFVTWRRMVLQYGACARLARKIYPASGVGFRQNGCSTPRISAPPPLELFLPPLEGWSKKLNSSSLPGQFRSTFSTQPSLAISNKLACQQRAGSIYSFRCHPRNNVF